jgi:HSP20 family protein
MAEAASKLPTKTERETSAPSSGEWPPLVNLRREIDRLFEDFGFGGGRRAVGRSVFDIEPFWRGELTFGKTPAVDIVEKDKEYEITAELPGLDENNVEVKFADGFLTIKGEKREEKEEEREEDRDQEGLSLARRESVRSAKDRARFSRHARRDQAKISPPPPPQRTSGEARARPHHDRLRNRLAQGLRQGRTDRNRSHPCP